MVRQETQLTANRSRNPGFFDKLSKKLEALIADEKARRIDSAEYVKKCEFLLEESVSGIDKKRKELGLNEFELAVFENLTVKYDDEKICLDSTKEISKIII